MYEIWLESCVESLNVITYRVFHCKKLFVYHSAKKCLKENFKWQLYNQYILPTEKDLCSRVTSEVVGITHFLRADILWLNGELKAHFDYLLIMMARFSGYSILKILRNSNVSSAELLFWTLFIWQIRLFIIKSSFQLGSLTFPYIEAW